MCIFVRGASSSVTAITYSTKMNSPKWKLSKWKPCNMVTRFYLSFIFASNRTYTETCYLVWTLEICFQYNASFKLGRTKYTFFTFLFFCLLYITFHLTLFFCFWLQVSHCTHAVQRIGFFLIRLNSQPKYIWKRIAQKL